MTFIAGMSHPMFSHAVAVTDTCTRLTWDEDDSSLVDLPTQPEFLETISSCPENEPCFSCGLELQQEAEAEPRPLPGGGLSQHGVNYHINDFVYIKRTGSGLYQIAQIKKIRAMQVPPQVIVSIFDRHNDYKRRTPAKGGASLVSDEVRSNFHFLYCIWHIRILHSVV
jgi:DNA (cytosine-5)-methyltransferase 1